MIQDNRNAVVVRWMNEMAVTALRLEMLVGR